MLYVFWNLKFLYYVFFLVFLERHFKKRKKSRILDFEKNVKYVFSNYASSFSASNGSRTVGPYKNEHESAQTHTHRCRQWTTDVA